MQQAGAGRTEVVRALVNAGAKLDTLSTKWHSTALTQALDAERMDVVRILRDAGAKDDTVTESRGQAVSEDDPAVQTVFLVPPRPLVEISSSFVKGLTVTIGTPASTSRRACNTDWP